MLAPVVSAAPETVRVPLAETWSALVTRGEMPSEEPLLPTKVMLPEGATNAAPVALVTVALSSVTWSAVRLAGAAATVVVVVVVVLVVPLMLLPQPSIRKQKATVKAAAEMVLRMRCVVEIAIAGGMDGRDVSSPAAGFSAIPAAR